jgi:hypothetical protein
LALRGENGQNHGAVTMPALDQIESTEGNQPFPEGICHVANGGHGIGQNQQIIHFTELPKAKFYFCYFLALDSLGFACDMDYAGTEHNGQHCDTKFDGSESYVAHMGPSIVKIADQLKDILL